MAYRSTSLAKASRVGSPGARPDDVERLEKRIDSLLAEREALKIELALARGWVRELAHLVEAKEGSAHLEKGQGGRSFAAALRQRCGLCGHTRLWHHLHLVPWGRE
jgi:hypothetical protein